MMKMYNEFCPYCGYLNRHLLLEETDGWMECEKCCKDSKVKDFPKSQKMTALKSKGITLHMQLNGEVA